MPVRRSGPCCTCRTRHAVVAAAQPTNVLYFDERYSCSMELCLLQRYGLCSDAGAGKCVEGCAGPTSGQLATPDAGDSGCNRLSQGSEHTGLKRARTSSRTGDGYVTKKSRFAVRDIDSEHHVEESMRAESDALSGVATAGTVCEEDPDSSSAESTETLGVPTDSAAQLTVEAASQEPSSSDGHPDAASEFCSAWERYNSKLQRLSKVQGPISMELHELEVSYAEARAATERFYGTWSEGDKLLFGYLCNQWQQQLQLVLLLQLLGQSGLDMGQQMQEQQLQQLYDMHCHGLEQGQPAVTGQDHGFAVCPQQHGRPCGSTDQDLKQQQQQGNEEGVEAEEAGLATVTPDVERPWPQGAQQQQALTTSESNCCRRRCCRPPQPAWPVPIPRRMCLWPKMCCGSQYEPCGCANPLPNMRASGTLSRMA